MSGRKLAKKTRSLILILWGDHQDKCAKYFKALSAAVKPREEENGKRINSSKEKYFIIID